MDPADLQTCATSSIFKSGCETCVLHFKPLRIIPHHTCKDLSPITPDIVYISALCPSS